jgi:two-component system, response regulator, stage 0 sporulation protein A
MHRWKVLLADDNRSFLDLLASRINAEEEFEVIYAATDGEDALLGISEHKPDIVILDIIMPRLDGIAVQERLQEMPVIPKIIIFSALGMDHITRQTLALGADAYFLKPFDLEVFIRRLRYLMGEDREQQLSKSRKLSDEELDRRVTDMLHKLAVAPHLKGYRYLKKAIIDVINDKGMLESITYRVYPSIAEMFSSTPTRVERAIRCSIENAWDRCRVETIEQVFGYTLDENKGNPSNSEFIAMIADKVMLEKNRKQ